jgi:hypothetical protein
MSAPGGANTSSDCGCDPEKVFELADGGLNIRELYERERDLSVFLSSLDFSRLHSRSVCESVAMALPTRSLGARILWGLFAGVLLVAAFVSLELNGTEPVILAMSILSACWALISGSVEAARVVFANAGTTILLALALGALVDALLALAVVFARNRGRRAREA